MSEDVSPLSHKSWKPGSGRGSHARSSCFLALNVRALCSGTDVPSIAPTYWGSRSPRHTIVGGGRAGRNLCCLDEETESQSWLKIDEAAESPMRGAWDLDCTPFW